MTIEHRRVSRETGEMDRGLESRPTIDISVAGP